MSAYSADLNLQANRITEAAAGIEAISIVLKQILESSQIESGEGKCDTVFNDYVRGGLLDGIKRLTDTSYEAAEYIRWAADRQSLSKV